MSNMFSRNPLRDSAAVFLQKLCGVLQDMEDTISASETGTGGTGTETTSLGDDCRKNAETDLKDLLLRLLFAVTSKIAFGVDLNTISNNSTKDQHPFFTASDEMSYLIFKRGSDPLFPIKRRFGIGSEKRITN